MDGLEDVVGEILTTALITKKGCWFLAALIGFIVIGVCIWYNVKTY